jgi:hypothetical protein
MVVNNVQSLVRSRTFAETSERVIDLTNNHRRSCIGHFKSDAPDIARSRTGGMHCKREERITSENRHCFAERHMNCWTTSSHEIVVESWKIIMNETECMHHFDSSCSLDSILHRSTDCFTASQSEQGPKPFSAPKKSV